MQKNAAKAVIKVIACWYFALSLAYILFALHFFFTGVQEGPVLWILFLACFPAALGVTCCIVARGLLEFKEWARLSANTLAIVIIALLVLLHIYVSIVDESVIDKLFTQFFRYAPIPLLFSLLALAFIKPIKQLFLRSTTQGGK